MMNIALRLFPLAHVIPALSFRHTRPTLQYVWSVRWLQQEWKNPIILLKPLTVSRSPLLWSHVLHYSCGLTGNNGLHGELHGERQPRDDRQLSPGMGGQLSRWGPLFRMHRPRGVALYGGGLLQVRRAGGVSQGERARREKLHEVA